MMVGYLGPVHLGGGRYSTFWIRCACSRHMNLGPFASRGSWGPPGDIGKQNGFGRAAVTVVFLFLVLSIRGAAGLLGRGVVLEDCKGSGGGSLTELESFFRRFGKDFSCFILGLAIVYLWASFLILLIACCIILAEEILTMARTILQDNAL